MTKKTVKPAEKALASKKASLQGRIKSDFPKHTLEEALRVPRAIEEANGGRPLPPTETAIALGMSPGSSEFRTILSSSIKYGLTSGSFNQERVALEKLGRDIVEPTSEEGAREAMVTSCLNPPTFRAIYDYFKGKKLPEASFFQNAVVREFQVPREHAEKCVSIFNANMEHIGLVRLAKTGRWLSSEPIPSAMSSVPTEEQAGVEEETGPAKPATTGSATEQPKAPSGGNAIFIGHGKNKRPLDQLKQILDQYKIPYKVAVQEPNRFRPISQKVAEIMQECGAAILVFTGDEEFRDSGGNVLLRPSENVVYELGAASVLYGGKIIVFKEEGVDFPTNFRDIGYISFKKDDLSSKTNELFSELIAFGLIRVTVGI